MSDMLDYNSPELPRALLGDLWRVSNLRQLATRYCSYSGTGVLLLVDCIGLISELTVLEYPRMMGYESGGLKTPGRCTSQSECRRDWSFRP